MSERPKDTSIDAHTDIEAVSKNMYHGPSRHKVRIYKYSPDRVALQIFGLRANTQMYANAYMTKEALTALRDAATALLEFF